MNKKKIHDALLKRMLEEPGFPEAFFDALLPAALTRHFRWESLRMSKSSFVDEELRQHFSDAFFEVELKLPSGKERLEIALLVEHKSHPDHFVVVQLMRYLLQAYEHQIKHQKRKQGRLAPILPLVVYHGGGKWKAKSFAELFGSGFEDFQEYFLRIPFLFRNINQMTDEEILSLESTLLRAMFLTQRHSHDPALLFLHLDTIAKNLPSGNPSEALVVYIFMLLKADYSKEQIIQQITPDMATTFKSFYDKLIEEGMEKGIERERLNTIYRMYNAKLNLEQIAVAVGLTMEEVKKILGLEGE
jgi:predicted transposase/invertase (TIGR01784 family)